MFNDLDWVWLGLLSSWFVNDLDYPCENNQNGCCTFKVQFEFAQCVNGSVATKMNLCHPAVPKIFGGDAIGPSNVSSFLITCEKLVLSIVNQLFYSVVNLELTIICRLVNLYLKKMKALVNPQLKDLL